MFKRIVPHMTIILSLMFIAFIALNQYNPHMGFISSRASQCLLALLCASACLSSVLLVEYNRKYMTAPAKRRKKKKR